MAGMKDLGKLLKTMKPAVVPGEYVFCSLSNEEFPKLDKEPVLFFREREGITVIISKEEAESKSLEYSGVWGMITLSVHSDLHAVGFLAEISRHLAEAGISLNVVSGYYHDHLFVPYGKTGKAMDILESLSGSR
ncbi:MAG: ACT domain-containing protein [Candidatus Aenigmarchaeota archaeon]|nr:ACT domain-containing protein [Candidatus Aenigmarchaeota archaeon]